MNNGTEPLQGYLLLLTQLEFVAPTTVAGTFYGVAFTLFCLYVHSLVPQLQDDDRKRGAKFMLGYTVIIMLCGLYNLVSNAWVTQDAYIKHGDYPGGPYVYISSTFNTSAVVTIAVVCQMAVEILSSAIQVWRVWVIWSATRYAKAVIVLPSLCFLLLAVLKLRSIILAATLSAAEEKRLDAKTQLVQLAIQVAITILCTMLISLYLVYQHLRQRKLLGKANGSAGYMKIVAMLIESYSLESIWTLMGVILYPRPASVAFFLEGKTYIQIIAYLLVQYQVASGKAYESQRGQTNVSSLHWNHSSHTTMQAAMETHDGGPHISTKPEGSETLPVSSMA